MLFGCAAPSPTKTGRGTALDPIYHDLIAGSTCCCAAPSANTAKARPAVTIFSGGPPPHVPKGTRIISIDDIYRKSAGPIHEGMTRQQVYAVLPPFRCPAAFPPRIVLIAGIAIYSYHREIHPIDAHRGIEILYRLADPKNYPDSELANPKKALDLNRDRRRDTPVPSAQNPRDVVYRVTVPHDLHSPWANYDPSLELPGDYYDVLLEKPPMFNF